MLHVVGTVLLVLLCALAALVLCLLFFPVWALVDYHHGALSVRVRVLFVTFRVYPLPQKKKKRAPKQAPQAGGGQKRSPGKKFTLTFEKLTALVSDAAGLLRRALAALRVRDIRVVLPVQGRDAADTALFYGRFCAWFYGGIAALQNALDLRFDSIEIIPDFAGENKYRTSFYCKIGATPFIMIFVAIRAFAVLRADGLLPGPAAAKHKKKPGKAPKTQPSPAPQGTDSGAEKTDGRISPQNGAMGGNER